MPFLDRLLLHFLRIFVFVVSITGFEVCKYYGKDDYAYCETGYTCCKDNTKCCRGVGGFTVGAIVGMVFGAMAGLVLICVGLSYGCKKLSARINRPKRITSPMQPVPNTGGQTQPPPYGQNQHSTYQQQNNLQPPGFIP